MHRIAGYGKLEMPLKSGFFWFTNGDLGGSTPIPRTIIEDDFLNAIQEEIAACIEYQGTALNAASEISTTMKQLHDAIGQSWVTWEYLAAGTITELEGRNASVVYAATGKYTVTWDTAFADVNYCITATAGYTDDQATALIATIANVAVGSCIVYVKDDTGASKHVAGMRVSIRASGTQA